MTDGCSWISALPSCSQPHAWLTCWHGTVGGTVINDCPSSTRQTRRSSVPASPPEPDSHMQPLHLFLELDKHENKKCMTAKSATYAPSVSPTYAPSVSPSYATSVSPTYATSVSPTYATSVSPTYAPSVSPTYATSVSPTYAPSVSPSYATSASPTYATSVSPTYATSVSPTYATSVSPTYATSVSPTYATSVSPTYATSVSPTYATSVSSTYATSVSPTYATSVSSAYATSVSAQRQISRVPESPGTDETDCYRIIKERRIVSRDQSWTTADISKVPGLEHLPDYRDTSIVQWDTVQLEEDKAELHGSEVPEDVPTKELKLGRASSSAGIQSTTSKSTQTTEPSSSPGSATVLPVQPHKRPGDELRRRVHKGGPRRDGSLEVLYVGMISEGSHSSLSSKSSQQTAFILLEPDYTLQWTVMENTSTTEGEASFTPDRFPNLGETSKRLKGGASQPQQQPVSCSHAVWSQIILKILLKNHSGYEFLPESVSACCLCEPMVVPHCKPANQSRAHQIIQELSKTVKQLINKPTPVLFSPRPKPHTFTHSLTRSFSHYSTATHSHSRTLQYTPTLALTGKTLGTRQSKRWSSELYRPSLSITLTYSYINLSLPLCAADGEREGERSERERHTKEGGETLDSHLNKEADCTLTQGHGRRKPRAEDEEAGRLIGSTRTKSKKPKALGKTRNTTKTKHQGNTITMETNTKQELRQQQGV
ncbi:hypothetical protein NFI96_000582 [Prochilodus magdalenae]|nr:hypothetical protein NFI96_000582 [Prochilodus magdalenae]